MENLNFENFFGSSVAIHDSKAVSCAYREMPKDENFTGMESNMGENIYIFFLSFFHFDGCTSSILDHIENRINHGCLTPNTPQIHTSFTYSKLNMDDIYGLKFYLLYVHTSQKFLLKSLHAQRRSFLLLNLYF